ncbi:glycosyltransferase [Microbacterium sp. NPDC056044]|uniref:glycosyltransferase n=1 Tax=Microbacterium sp. NPDC056044 TaxID=3345690 RepID=UPI0035DE4193
MSARASRRYIRARTAAAFFAALVGITDALPPRIRYGYVHRLTGLLWRRPLPALTFSPARPAVEGPSSSDLGEDAIVCALLTGAMDVGGIGSVVEVLATSLPRAGVRPVVVCTEDGTRANRLRAAGVDVRVAVAEDDAQRVFAELAPQVAQLHAAPEHLVSAAQRRGIPVVPVLHNTEIHYSRARWRRFAELLQSSAAAIAVSELVRDYHARHVPASTVELIRVVPNAIPAQAPVTADERRNSRDALATVLGADLGDDIVFVCLARYDSQKNIAGLVAAFGKEVTDVSARLVVAGEPSDWVELRRADAIRRSAPGADRIALLGASDARALLAAADAFVLDSFFEGWPVAATEAAAFALPLVLADFGGARELVARDVGASVLVANATGPAALVSDRRVARARRGVRRQPNAAAVGVAVDNVASRVRTGARPRVLSSSELIDAMTDGHAAVLRSVAAGRDGTVGGARDAFGGISR